MKIFPFNIILISVCFLVTDLAGMNKNLFEGSVWNLKIQEVFSDPQVATMAKSARKGKCKKIKDLISSGVDVNCIGYRGISPLFFAFENFDGFKCLLQNGANPNIILDDNLSYIHLAAGMEDTRFLEQVLKAGGDPNLYIKDSILGPTPIFFAMFNSKENLEQLLEAGANLEVKNSWGATPLIRACAHSEYEIAYILLQYGADFDVKDKSGDDISDLLDNSRRFLDKSSERYHWMLKVENYVRGIQLKGQP